MLGRPLFRARTLPLGPLIHGLPFLLIILSPTWGSCCQSSSCQQVPWSMGSGLHMLIDFSSGSWWVDCGTVLSHGISGCCWVSFPSCHLSQFLTHSLSARWELRAPSPWCGCSLLSRQTASSWEPLLRGCDLRAALWDCVKRVCFKGPRCFKTSSETNLCIDFLLCQKLKKQEGCFLKNKQQQKLRAVWYRKQSSHLVEQQKKSTDMKTMTLQWVLTVLLKWNNFF